ncbi:FliM/FliN family flagellar motor switch protein [Winslowiella iniecta]|uniref:Aldolase n=1 Tax=Winslowiella iniecta TaxID=1560201 RepID=A0A0L7TH42_9GAMM|nr:FliM/FliN family flagellar motor switch protein [Winslowiella iniecta]KOC91367.1 aldolase [Winslowiella iniecta]KOC94672.1 aldolase [Winslowiella iniecta]
MKPLQLRQQSRLEARLRQKIGSGYRFPYRLNGEAGWLQLSLTASDAPRPATQAVQCDSGLLHLSDAEAVCSLMSCCPLLLEPEAEEAWYWPLFNQSLSDPLRCLFGQLASQSTCPPPADALWLTLNVVLGELRGYSQLSVSLNTLALLLNKAGWQPVIPPPADKLALRLPLTLGALSFSLEQLRTLRRNDVILPTTRHFSPAGSGVLRVAHLSLQGELVSEQGRSAHFYITDLETTDVNLTPDDYEMDGMPQPDEEWSSEPHSETSVFDPLPLALTLRCGHLKLTLGELNRLSAGSTVLVEHVQPGEAILCHGDYPLAKGELVDVEGQLGLQITHMLPGAGNPLAEDR